MLGPPPVYDRRSFPESTSKTARLHAECSTHHTKHMTERDATHRSTRTTNGKTMTEDERYLGLAAAKEAGLSLRDTCADNALSKNDVHPLLRSISEPQNTSSGPNPSSLPPQHPLQRQYHTRRSAGTQIVRQSQSKNNSSTTINDDGSRYSQATLTSARMSEPFLSQVYVTNLEPGNSQKALLNYYKKWTATKRNPHDSQITHQKIDTDDSIRSTEEPARSHHPSIVPRAFLRRHRNTRTSLTIDSLPTSDDSQTSLHRNLHQKSHNEAVKAFPPPPKNTSSQFPTPINMVGSYPIYPAATTRSIRKQDESSTNSYTLPQPSRAAPPAPTSRPTLVTALPWQHIRPPYSPAAAEVSVDKERVETWLSDTQPPASIPRPVTPPSPASMVFTDKGSSRHVSTAPSSPIERMEAELEGDMPPIIVKRSGNPTDLGVAMTSCITDWKDLDGCTPDFVHSVRFLKIVAATCSAESSLSDTTSDVDFEEVDETLKSAEDVEEVSDDEVVDGNTSKNTTHNLNTASNDYKHITMYDSFTKQQADEQQIKERQYLSKDLGLVELETKPSKVVTPSTPSSTTVSIQETTPASRKLQRPHVGRLIIPDTTPSITSAPVSCTSHLFKMLPPLPFDGTTQKSREEGFTITKDETILEALSQWGSNWHQRDEDSATLPAAAVVPATQLTTESVQNETESGHENIVGLAQHSTFSNSEFANTNDETNENILGSGLVVPPIPPRLSDPLTAVNLPSLVAPAGGVTLHVGRQCHYPPLVVRWHISTMVTSPPSLFSSSSPQPVPFFISHSSEFEDVITFALPSDADNPLFTLKRCSTDLRIGQTDKDRNLFTVREMPFNSIDSGGWYITFKSSKNLLTRWDARAIVTGTRRDRKDWRCSELLVSDENGNEMGVIEKEHPWNLNVRLPGSNMEEEFLKFMANDLPQYLVHVKSGVNCCILTALTTVFHEWRCLHGFKSQDDLEPEPYRFV